MFDADGDGVCVCLTSVKLYLLIGDLFPNPLWSYVCIVMYAYVSVLGIFGVFLGCTVLMSLYLLACGNTWHCKHTLFCVAIDKRRIKFFIHLSS